MPSGGAVTKPGAALGCWVAKARARIYRHNAAARPPNTQKGQVTGRRAPTKYPAGSLAYTLTLSPGCRGRVVAPRTPFSSAVHSMPTRSAVAPQAPPRTVMVSSPSAGRGLSKAMEKVSSSISASQSGPFRL